MAHHETFVPVARQFSTNAAARPVYHRNISQYELAVDYVPTLDIPGLQGELSQMERFPDDCH